MFEKILNKLDHLPVNKIASLVAQNFNYGQIPIVTSQVASGKTLILPVMCAIESADSGPIYVLEPNRQLANNAAETLRELMDGQNDNLIGVLNSSRSDDPSSVHPDNIIIFTTVGYALAAGIVSEANNIIFDEAHETSTDLSLSKAIVAKRIREGEKVRTALFSATLDLENEMEFWGVTSVHLTTEGSAHPLQHLHRPGMPISEAVAFLLDVGRKGVLVFVEGKEEIDLAVQEITAELLKGGLERGRHYELDTMHGNSTGKERHNATMTPHTPFKVLVGTNVLESGLNLPWVDGGVSSGKTKMMYGHGNVQRLMVEELPAWRLTQQGGRVCRFCPGIFILVDQKDIHERPNMHDPDIVRLPLTDLAMHVAKLGGIDPRQLVFSKKEQPPALALREAIETLEYHKLIVETDEGHLALTEDGEKTERMPIGFRAMGAMCEAELLGEVSVLLPLIAMIEVGDIRFDTRTQPMWGHHQYSDLVSLVAQVATLRKRREETPDNFYEIARDLNVNTRKYKEYQSVLRTLEDATDTDAKFWPYITDDPVFRDKLKKLAKQVIFRAMIDARFRVSAFREQISTMPIHKNRLSYNTVQFTKSSVCFRNVYGALFTTGSMRTISPKDQMPFTVLENATLFTRDDIPFLMKRFGKDIVDPWLMFEELPKQVEPKIFQPRRVGYVTEVFAPKKESARGGFGDLLAAAMEKNK